MAYTGDTTVWTLEPAYEEDEKCNRVGQDKQHHRGREATLRENCDTHGHDGACVSWDVTTLLTDRRDDEPRRKQVYSFRSAISVIHVALSGSSILTFRDNLSVPSSRVKKSLTLEYRSHLQGSRNPWPLNMGPIGCPETSVQNYHSALRNIPEERSSQRHRAGNLKSRRFAACPLQEKEEIYATLHGVKYDSSDTCYDLLSHAVVWVPSPCFTTLSDTTDYILNPFMRCRMRVFSCFEPIKNKKVQHFWPK
jgi:hypothetical protein